MANTWLNPNARLHSDMLRGQINVAQSLIDRFIREERAQDCEDLFREMQSIYSILLQRHSFAIQEAANYRPHFDLRFY